MANELRKSGISIVGDIPWGTHFCSFYATTQDLLDILVPYFTAGLENNEFGLWVISNSELLTGQEAISALRNAVPDLDRDLAERSIEVVGHDAWFLDAGAFDFHSVVNRFKEKLDDAVARGYVGMRVNGSPAWIQNKQALREFEQEFDRLFRNERMIASCTYPLAESGAAELLDVARTHRFAIARRQGNWEVLETPELMQAKQEIQRLNAELEQRVIERTSELAATNAALRREIVQRQRAEDELRQQKVILQKIFDYIPVMIAFVGEDGRVELVNRAWERSLGWTLHELEEQQLDIYALAYPDPQYRQHVLDVVAAATGEWTDLKVRVRDGRVIDMTVAIVHLSDGTSLVIAQDITERKQAEEALRRSESNFRTLADKSLQGIAIFQDQKIVYTNPAQSAVLGYTVEELKSMSVEQIIALTHPIDRPVAVERARKRIAGEELSQFIELRILRKDGSSGWIQSFNNLIEYNGQPAILTASIDITERKQAEEEIRRHAARMEALAEISRTFVEAGLSYQSVLNTVAQRTAELIGDSCGLFQLSEDRRRARPMAFHHPNPQVLALMRELLLKAWSGAIDTPIYDTLLAGEPLRIPVVTPEEIRPWIQPEFWPFMDRVGIYSLLIVPLRIQGLVIGALCLSRDQPGHPYTYDDQVLLQDIADRAAMAIQNAQLFEQVQGAHERLQALSRQVLQAQEVERRAIARELHDEIGQQLSGVGILLSIINRQLPSELAQARLETAQALVGDLIAQVRNLALNLRPAILDDFGLMPALVWLFERYTTQTQIAVQFEHPALEEQRFAPEVETTAYRIVQEALTNVARHAGVTEVTVRLWIDADTLWVVVADQGRGFDPHAIDTRTSSGLAGMVERAALLGGNLTIESAPGTGTHVTASLPLHSDGEPRGQEHDA